MGVGLTVIVKVSCVPVHPFAVGLTMMVAITGVAPVLIAVNGPIFPVPLAASPIVASLFVQLKVVPLTTLLKLIAEVVAPLQTV